MGERDGCCFFSIVGGSRRGSCAILASSPGTITFIITVDVLPIGPNN